jgi:Ca2+-binding EF-hand superfamily protein
MSGNLQKFSRQLFVKPTSSTLSLSLFVCGGDGKSGENSRKFSPWLKITAAGAAFAAGVSCYAFLRKDEFLSSRFSVSAKRKKEVQTDAAPKMTHRERRFLVFASVEYNGDIFMTPRDFLDSVTQDQPRNRLKRRSLNESEVNAIVKSTPTFDKGSRKFFRKLDTNGLLSYTEYLFLLCILTKPEEGFRIAFNMFDTDGNQRVDKKEFLVIQALMLMLRAGGKVINLDPYLDTLPQNVKYWMKDSKLQLTKQTKMELGDLLIPDKSHQVVEAIKVQDTSLLIHFFGHKGNQTLNFDDFRRFMDNLQTEVLEIEFNEFARGKQTITESDFARILLRYTSTTMDDKRNYIERLHERLPNEGGITFEQFRLFCRFLNTLEDFTIAVKLYTYADLPVSQAEFARAVKVATGFALDPHVVDVVFKIFDVNNDARLSYSEFIAVMKERLHRGFRARNGPTEGWPAFRRCVREELKRY